MQSLILESGACWPEWVVRRADAGALAVVEQRQGETPKELFERVRALVEKQRSALELCVIACSERCDPAVTAMRQKLVQSLLQNLTPAGRIMLSASDRSHGPARRALTDLACELDDGSGRVTVAFGEHDLDRTRARVRYAARHHAS